MGWVVSIHRESEKGCSRKVAAASFSEWHHAFGGAGLPYNETGRRRRQPTMSEDPNQQDADVEELTPAQRKARRRRRGSEANGGGGGSTGDEPDVLLDVSELEVDRISLEVENLRAHVSVLAELANLVSLSVGADARLDRVKLEIEGVRAKVLLKVRLEHVRAILEKALDTIGEHPEILESLGQTLDALLKGRLEDARDTLQDILESHGGGGTEREALSEEPVNDTGSSAPEQRSGDDSSSS